MSHPMQLSLVPGQSIESYVQTLKRIPLLSLEEERSLAERLQQNNDIESARRLVMSHLRFVVHIAHSYKGYGLPQSDLIQEGNIGLMKAVKRFDPNVGVRLVSFAVHWIRAEIHEYILKNWRIVKIATTKSQRKLFFNLRSAKKKASWLSGEEAKKVAEDLGVSLKDVLEMEGRLNSNDTAFDGSPENDDDEDYYNPSAYLEDNRYDPANVSEEEDWNEYHQKCLYQAISKLDDRSQDIVKKRWLEEDKKHTLQDLATNYSVSAERIRQLEQNALSKLRNNLKQAA